MEPDFQPSSCGAPKREDDETDVCGCFPGLHLPNVRVPDIRSLHPEQRKSRKNDEEWEVVTPNTEASQEGLRGGNGEEGQWGVAPSDVIPAGFPGKKSEVCVELCDANQERLPEKESEESVPMRGDKQERLPRKKEVEGAEVVIAQGRLPRKKAVEVMPRLPRKKSSEIGYSDYH